ncbi:MAG TPA: hypothetical protein VNI52_06000 [Sphingobacteriaceae bacterium]|nr:hypothetical protein [Sphingobacteriaceae bacterium]
MNKRESGYVQINMETTRLSQGINYLLRNGQSFYAHGQIVHGYTHNGQVLGAGIGPGTNLQSMQMKWFRGLNSWGVDIERYTFNNDFYGIRSNYKRDSRIDIVMGLNASKKSNGILLCLNLQGVKTTKSRQNSDSTFLKDADNEKFNIFSRVAFSYQF